MDPNRVGELSVLGAPRWGTWNVVLLVSTSVDC